MSTKAQAEGGQRRRGPGRRPGRRPGAADTRGEILAAARKVFAAKGFDKATVRGIAREAGVDPALVHHYFDSKEGVFVAAMQLPADPGEVIPRILDGPREQTGFRLVRELLTITASPQAREPMMALMRTAMTNEQAVGMVREFLMQAILGRVITLAGVSPLRAEAAFAQLFGMMAMRYIVKLEPLATVEIDELAEVIGPAVQRYLFDD
ncbi:TetR family transcriptional regulator [Spongiactinospora sp. TRM90649]|uniref:TetR/AcrR family transcriptional regulator n=1 Tax=Spongiactinospora sp. TRM90649 TaxID=3031114 RepID=UPI0023F74A2A|nr:TetR family transcriptional regulator [Spongiactinospora sp. TRM90649]MDF5759300.1 TetR family transcriptional regulator [Spongiactinospora sp. TRM90649]